MVNPTDLFSWLVSVFGFDDPAAGLGLGFLVTVGGVANGVRSGENGFSPQWCKCNRHSSSSPLIVTKGKTTLYLAHKSPQLVTYHSS